MTSDILLRLAKVWLCLKLNPLSLVGGSGRRSFGQLAVVAGTVALLPESDSVAGGSHSSAGPSKAKCSTQ